MPPRARRSLKPKHKTAPMGVPTTRTAAVTTSRGRCASKGSPSRQSSTAAGPKSHHHPTHTGDDCDAIERTAKPDVSGHFAEVEPAGIEPATSCLQSSREPSSQVNLPQTESRRYPTSTDDVSRFGTRTGTPTA